MKMSGIQCWRYVLILSLLAAHTTSAADPVWVREPVSPIPCYPGVDIILPWVYDYADVAEKPLLGITFRHGSYVILNKPAGQPDVPGAGYDSFVESVLGDYNAGIKIKNCDTFPNGMESEKLEVVAVFEDSVTLPQTYLVTVLNNYTKSDQNVELHINHENINSHNIYGTTSPIAVPPELKYPVDLWLVYDDDVFPPRVSFHKEADNTVLKQYNCQDSPTSGQCEVKLTKDEAHDAQEGKIYIVVNQYEKDSDSGLKTQAFQPEDPGPHIGVIIGAVIGGLVALGLVVGLIVFLVKKKGSGGTSGNFMVPEEKKSTPLAERAEEV